MTREEELIELLDQKGSAMDCNDDVLREQQKNIEGLFGEFHLPCVITRVYRAPQVNCYDFTIENEDRFECYKSLQIVMTLGLEVYKISAKVRIVQLDKGKKECRMEVPNGKYARWLPQTNCSVSLPGAIRRQYFR